MPATLTEMVNEILGHRFSPSQYTTFAQTQINRAQEYVCAQTDFREMESSEDYTTVSGTATLTLPDDFQRNFSLIYFDAGAPVRVLWTERTDFEMMSPLDTGPPSHYSIEGNEIKLYPTPDGEYEVRLGYYRLPTVMGVNDSLEIPAEDLVMHRALKRCYERENDYTSAAYHDQEFEKLIMKKRGEVHSDTNDASHPRVVPGY